MRDGGWRGNWLQGSGDEGRQEESGARDKEG